MGDSLRLLAQLWYRPSAAMSGVLDRGSLLFACLAAAAVSLLMRRGDLAPLPFYVPLLLLAAVYVPGALVLAILFGRLGGVGAVFPRDYAPLLTCAAMAWSAANAPLVLAAWMAPLPVFLILAGLAYGYFAVLMYLAIRTVTGAGGGAAAATVALSWIPVVVAAPLSFLFSWIASPFFLLFAWYYLGGEISGLGSGLRARQHFRRTLEAAALNPHDAGAQYQLGLVYQRRRQYAEAIEHFRKAVAIDPKETDAHFQLGRIAREQGRLKDALGAFQTVLDQDESHSSSEILREIGAMYLDARQYGDALRELETYLERRPYDCEALCYYGEALEKRGEFRAAGEAYTRAIEAARMAPRFRQRDLAPWSRQAQKRLRKLPK